MGLKVLTPSSFKEALDLIKDNDGTMLPISGGTDVIVDIKYGRINPKILVDLSKVKEYRDITIKDNRLEIGALVAHSQIGFSPILTDQFNALKLAAMVVGGPQIRNSGTIGGNIQSGSPAADLPPTLLVFNARLTLESIAGTREVSLEDYFLGARKTILRQNELISKIIIDLDDSLISTFYKIGKRNSLAISIVNLAATLEIDDEGKCRKAFIALGSVAAIPKKAYNVERYLINRELDTTTINEARKMLEMDISPISDIRADSEFRMLSAKNLLAKALITIDHEWRIRNVTN